MLKLTIACYVRTICEILIYPNRLIQQKGDITVWLQQKCDSLNVWLQTDTRTDMKWVGVNVYIF